jgi:predicted RNA binding protein YcfA (HicA-like mRNA interferase family)
MGDSEFPSLKATKLLQILKKRLGYTTKPGSRKGGGSHCYLVADGRNTIRWAFHNKVNIPPRSVKSVLVDQAGLTVEEAKEVLGID